VSVLKVKNSNEIVEVQNVYCVGKNYLDLINEMDIPGIQKEIPAEPVIFLKPNTAVVSDSFVVSIPELNGRKISNNLQNEVELVIIIGKDGKNIAKENSFEYVYGYAVGIDFTLRDLQNEDKKKGLPWTVSKGFFTSAPVSEMVRKEEIRNPENLRISLEINGELKQDAITSEMIFKLDFIIHYISTIFGLRKGDIIFTGTPAGVAKLNSGDVIKAKLELVGELTVKVA
jgi:2-keto-4-pentenoate hydratase/2-oxohepta-3-ene-1,7-dioic acid hydratase in catechol pathway